MSYIRAIRGSTTIESAKHHPTRHQYHGDGGGWSVFFGVFCSLQGHCHERRSVCRGGKFFKRTLFSRTHPRRCVKRNSLLDKGTGKNDAFSDKARTEEPVSS